MAKIIIFEKNVKKFQWEMADEIGKGFVTTDSGLSKEEILKVIKELYTNKRFVGIGQRFMKAYISTTPNWKEDFAKVGIK